MWRSCMSAVALAASAFLSVMAPAAAQTGGTPPAATDRNVYAGGSQVRPAGVVKGDFSAAGGKVIVDAAVAGDAALAGGSVDVRAPVGDDVRAVGGDVTIESTVGGELFATGGNVTLASSSAVGRGASIYAGTVSVDGRVGGDLRATARTVTINGDVRGNVHLVAEDIALGPKARIGGTLTYVSGAELRRAEGATVTGAVTRAQEEPARNGPPGNRQWESSFQGPSWLGAAMSFLGLLAAAALFLLLLPRFAVAASQRIGTSPFLALGIGFGTVVALPVLAVLLFITLLGIPLGIALLAAYPALLLAGFVAGVLFIARRLASALRQAEPRGLPGAMAWFAAALLLTLLVARVPFVGVPLVGLLALAGVGGCVLELHGRRKDTAHGFPPAAAPRRMDLQEFPT